MKRFAANQSGNMALLFALAFSLVGVVGAIGIDSASLYHERRMMQAAVDLAALTAAGRPEEAQAIAEAVLAEAGFGNATRLVVTRGRYEPDPARPPPDRFIPDAAPVNAVRVALARPGRLYFGTSLIGAPTIAAEGLAMVEPQVAFSIGSGLASLNNGIANQILGSLLGADISLSLVQYDGLAKARVGALDFLDALAFEMEVTALTYDDLLGAKASAGQIAAALSHLVGGAERTALMAIDAAGGSSKVSLRKLFELGRLGSLSLNAERSAAIGADLSVLDILSAAAVLADGSRQVGLGLKGGLPGIAEIAVSLVVGEPEQGSGWFAFGPVDTVLRTAQVRLRLEVTVGKSIGGSLIHLPVWLDLAHAEATITSLTCPSADDPLGTAEVAVLPGVAELAIGKVSNAQMRNFGAPLPVTPATLVDALLLRILASAHVEIAQANPVPLSFSSDEIEAGSIKTARTTGLLGAVTRSLLNDLHIEVPLLGLGLGLSLNGVGPTLAGILAPLAAPLDAVLDALLSALGLSIGEADIRVYGVRCSGPVLVG